MIDVGARHFRLTPKIDSQSQKENVSPWHENVFNPGRDIRRNIRVIYRLFSANAYPLPQGFAGCDKEIMDHGVCILHPATCKRPKCIMVIIKCPHCGERNQTEFRYGGEYNARPANLANFDEVSDAEAADFIYMKNNKWGVQKEWWYHRSGCQAWFMAERHTRTNEVVKTFLWESEK